MAAGDHETLAAAAHAIKSMSLNIGAVMVSQAAADGERAARAGTLDRTAVVALRIALCGRAFERVFQSAELADATKRARALLK